MKKIMDVDQVLAMTKRRRMVRRLREFACSMEQLAGEMNEFAQLLEGSTFSVPSFGGGLTKTRMYRCARFEHAQRLREGGLTFREIGRHLGVSASAVAHMLQRPRNGVVHQPGRTKP